MRFTLAALALATVAGAAQAVDHVKINIPSNFVTNTLATDSFIDVTALMPSSGTYIAAFVQVDWTAGPGNPFSNEARLTMRRDPLNNMIAISPAFNGAANGAAVPNMTFYSVFANTWTGGVHSFFFGGRQTFAGSSATFSNIRVSLISNWTLSNTTQANALDLGDFGSGGTIPININTDFSGRTIPNTVMNTEIALFDAAGNLLATDDDAGFSTNSLINTNLAEGTYYIAVGGFNSTFANGFVASGGTTTGRYHLSVNGVDDFRDLNQSGRFGWYRFDVVPAPGSAALLGLGLLAAARRRRA